MLVNKFYLLKEPALKAGSFHLLNMFIKTTAKADMHPEWKLAPAVTQYPKTDQIYTHYILNNFGGNHEHFGKLKFEMKLTLGFTVTPPF